MAISLAVARARRGPRHALAIGLAGAAAAASHGALDLATGESGARIRWPIGGHRMSLPDTLLPAAPMGPDIATWTGVRQMAGELAWAIPLALIGGWPWRHRLLDRVPART